MKFLTKVKFEYIQEVDESILEDGEYAENIALLRAMSHTPARDVRTVTVKVTPVTSKTTSE